MVDGTEFEGLETLERPLPPVEAIATTPLSEIIKITAPALALAACGGEAATTAPATGGGIVTPSPPPASPPPLTLTQSSRFLAQSTMGSSKVDIERVQSLGYAGWLNEQFAMPRPTSHWDWLVSQGFNAPSNKFSENGFDATMWRQLISSPDQLRQRVGMALLDFLVIGIDGVNGGWDAFSVGGYVDILLDNAFGNYRTLLEAISTSPAMGLYLTFLGNQKANPTTGSMPDENYARELMQLFALGVSKLNNDGSVQMAGAVALDSYTQEDVAGLARVFTGYQFASNNNDIPDRHRTPMVINAGQHETGVKTFLGSSIAAGTAGPASLTAALDIIFAHPNVPPFVCKQLIKRLVTSNPTPQYVSRVSSVFINNGSGVRGDMKSVVRAVLLDQEARSEAGLTGQTFGKLRAPVNRLTGWARAFGVNSPSQAWAFNNTSSSANRLSQSPGRSPSVFNFFRPGYTPPNTELSSRGLVGPEFQVTTEPSVIAYVNYMQSLIQNGAGDAKADYTAIRTLASDAQALVDEVNLIVAAGQITPTTLASIKTAVEAIVPTTTNGPINRVYTAILLTMASPEYIAQK